MHQTFNEKNFQEICNELAVKDIHFKKIIDEHAYPPVWTRPNNFSSLIHIILEQQVSLASAKAAFIKLKKKTGAITPAKLLALSDAELRECYFSRQKTVYARALATALVSKEISLKKLATEESDAIRTTLKKVKGIGDWTVDVYLLFVLHRTDVFPIGDLAMVNAMKEIKQLSKTSSKEMLLEMAESWRPYRSIAAMLMWHHYIKTRNIKL